MVLVESDKVEGWAGHVENLCRRHRQAFVGEVGEVIKKKFIGRDSNQEGVVQ